MLTLIFNALGTLASWAATGLLIMLPFVFLYSGDYLIASIVFGVYAAIAVFVVWYDSASNRYEHLKDFERMVKGQMEAEARDRRMIIKKWERRHAKRKVRLTNYIEAINDEWRT